jgi:hypothetical protein
LSCGSDANKPKAVFIIEGKHTLEGGSFLLCLIFGCAQKTEIAHDLNLISETQIRPPIEEWWSASKDIVNDWEAVRDMAEKYDHDKRTW